VNEAKKKKKLEADRHTEECGGTGEP